MNKYKNLTLIGTSHIAKESVLEVRKTIENEEPDIIAIELDRGRYIAITQNIKSKIDIRRTGIKIFLIAKLGVYIEKKLGKIVGVSPGSEMLEAIKLAKERKVTLALIDQDIAITFKKLSNALTAKVFFRLIKNFFKSLVKREYIKIDLTKVPKQKLINQILSLMKKDYPEIYNPLIRDRDKVMAKGLKMLMEKKPDSKIVAIVGAGHVQGILKILKGDKN